MFENYSNLLCQNSVNRVKVLKKEEKKEDVEAEDPPKKSYNPNAPSYRIRRAVAQLNREAKARGDCVFKKVVLQDCLKNDE